MQRPGRPPKVSQQNRFGLWADGTLRHSANTSGLNPFLPLRHRDESLITPMVPMFHVLLPLDLLGSITTLGQPASQQARGEHRRLHVRWELVSAARRLLLHGVVGCLADPWVRLWGTCEVCIRHRRWSNAIGPWLEHTSRSFPSE